MKRTIAGIAIAAISIVGINPTEAIAAQNKVTITTPAGGIATREAGAITGRVQIWIGKKKIVWIKYVGAKDTYTVVGYAKNHSIKQVANKLTKNPGNDVWGNPIASHL